MTTKEKIAVMQAWVDGKDVEFKWDDDEYWNIMLPNGLANVMWNWEECQYRIKPEPVAPKYRPWTPEEAIGKTIVSKISGTLMVVLVANKDNCETERAVYTYDSLLEAFHQLDGSPCGVEVKQ